MKLISFVIPCYRSEATIESVVAEIQETMEHAAYAYEIILVSDHSPDHVYETICSLAHKNPNIKGAEFTRNFGQHAALMAGYRIARGDIVVSLDDDGQTPANMALELVRKIEQGYDVVYASYPQKKHSAFRNWGSRVNDYMAEWLIGKPKNLQVSSYFAMTDIICREVTNYPHAFPYILGLITRSAAAVGNVDVQHRPRESGNSGYSLGKLLSLWLNGFTAFSVKPLRAATFTGMLVAGFGFLFGIYTVVHKIMNPSTPAGYSTVVTLLLLIGGVLMLMLGLIGEYIGRIYICINHSPQYVIRRAVNVQDAEEAAVQNDKMD